MTDAFSFSLDSACVSERASHLIAVSLVNSFGELTLKGTHSQLLIVMLPPMSPVAARGDIVVTKWRVERFSLKNARQQNT